MANELHPYARLCGGTNKNIHDPGIVVPRPAYLFHDSDTATYVKADRHKIFYKLLGNGQRKVVMVSPLAANHLQWEPQFKYFGVERSADFSVCVIDNRGIGFSGSPPGRWRTSDLANDILLVIDELGWKGIHLVGLSMGGMVSLEVALTRPDLISSLSLISTHAGGFGTIPPLQGARTLAKVFGTLRSGSAIDAGLEVMFPLAFLEKPSLVAFETPMPATRRFEMGRALCLRARCYVESGCFPEVRLNGVLKQLGGIVTHYVSWKRLRHLRDTGIPVLVCSGKLDNLIGWQNSVLLADALEGRHLHFADAGHCLNEQYPDEVNAALLETMDRGDTKTLAVRSVRPHRPGWHPGGPLVCLLALIARTWRHRSSAVKKRPWVAMAAATLAWRSSL